jgi:hypothetical protein
MPDFSSPTTNKDEEGAWNLRNLWDSDIDFLATDRSPNSSWTREEVILAQVYVRHWGDDDRGLFPAYSMYNTSVAEEFLRLEPLVNRVRAILKARHALAPEGIYIREFGQFKEGLNRPPRDSFPKMPPLTD